MEHSIIITKPDRKGLGLAVRYLREGKSVVYPTDTSYGLAVDATNPRAVRRLYKIKERSLRLPVHIVVSGMTMAKLYVELNQSAVVLFKKFLPGPLTIVAPLAAKVSRGIKILSAETGTLGIRMPKNANALKLVKRLRRPITATSANPPNSRGGYDSYSVGDVVSQFQLKKYQPDLILDAGRLPKHRPSTFVKLAAKKVKILRVGPIRKKQIMASLKHHGL